MNCMPRWEAFTICAAHNSKNISVTSLAKVIQEFLNSQLIEIYYILDFYNNFVNLYLFNKLKTPYLESLSDDFLYFLSPIVQQSSFYGFASMLPKQYTQAVMAGESIAGFLVSSNRVVTKMLIQNDRLSTVIFFLTSTLYVLLSYAMHLFTINSPFVRYHMKACAKIVLRPDEDRLVRILCYI